MTQDIVEVPDGPLPARETDYAYFIIGLVTQAAVPCKEWGIPWPPPPTLLTIGLVWSLYSTTDRGTTREAYYYPAELTTIESLPNAIPPQGVTCH